MSCSRLNVQNTAASPLCSAGRSSVIQAPDRKDTGPSTALISTERTPCWRKLTPGSGIAIRHRPGPAIRSVTTLLLPSAWRDTRSNAVPDSVT